MFESANRGKRIFSRQSHHGPAVVAVLKVQQSLCFLSGAGAHCLPKSCRKSPEIIGQLKQTDLGVAFHTHRIDTFLCFFN
jgi:hypothetical protein